MTDAETPWGETRPDPEEVWKYVEIDTAIEILQREGISSPEERVHNLVESIPDILRWLEEHGRNYPWRCTTDPWEVYIAEILLRKTQADIVDSVYSDFIEEYPDSESLYHAKGEEIKKRVKKLGLQNKRKKML